MKNLVSRLEAIARHEETLFPDVKAGDLASELAFLDRLGFVSAPIRIDIENLVHALEQALPFREMGRSNARIDEAVSHAADLCARTLSTVKRLIEQHAEEVALSVCAAGPEGTEADREPVTQDRPRLAAQPALPRPALVDDSPIFLERREISFLDGETGFGRVSGEAVIMKLGRSSTAAPVESAVLPEGALLRFAPGESFVLESGGMILGDRATAPKATHAMTILCEAGEGGVTLYGPAVVRFVGFPAGTLSRAAEVLERFLANACRVRCGEVNNNPRAALENGLRTVDDVDFVTIDVPHEITSGRLHADLVSMWPGCSFSQIHPNSMNSQESRIDFLQKHVEFALSIKRSRGMNFIPETMILARKGEEIRFIDVPKALPAPRRVQAMMA